jgi:hypothetical protein
MNSKQGGKRPSKTLLLLLPSPWTYDVDYFLICSKFVIFFQVIPVISSLTPVTTAVPLIGVLSLTAVKDAYDDIVSIPFQRFLTWGTGETLNFHQSKILAKIFSENAFSQFTISAVVTLFRNMTSEISSQNL